MDLTDLSPSASLPAGQLQLLAVQSSHGSFLPQPEPRGSATGRGEGFIWTREARHSAARNTFELLRSAVQYRAVTPISDIPFPSSVLIMRQTSGGTSMLWGCPAFGWDNFPLSSCCVLGLVREECWQH